MRKARLAGGPDAIARKPRSGGGRQGALGLLDNGLETRGLVDGHFGEHLARTAALIRWIQSARKLRLRALRSRVAYWLALSTACVAVRKLRERAL